MQAKLGSIVQVEEQPSPESRLPSSHCSFELKRSPLPHMSFFRRVIVYVDVNEGEAEVTVSESCIDRDWKGIVTLRDESDEWVEKDGDRVSEADGSEEVAVSDTGVE